MLINLIDLFRDDAYFFMGLDGALEDLTGLPERLSGWEVELADKVPDLLLVGEIGCPGVFVSVMVIFVDTGVPPLALQDIVVLHLLSLDLVQVGQELFIL